MHVLSDSLAAITSKAHDGMMRNEARVFLVVNYMHCVTNIAEMALHPFGYDIGASNDGDVLESVLIELDKWSRSDPVVASQTTDLKEVFFPSALKTITAAHKTFR